MEQVQHWRLLAVQSHFQLSVTASQPDKPASQGAGAVAGAGLRGGSGICGAHKLSKYVAKQPEKGWGEVETMQCL